MHDPEGSPAGSADHAGTGDRLGEALRLALAYRAARRSDHDAFLAEHDDLRDLLQGMIIGTDDDDDAAPAATPAGPAAAIGSRFGDYDLEHEVGRGGMGIVYQAQQRSLGRRIALKVLRSHLLLHERALWRFQREARLLSQLQHPGIVQVFDAGMVGDTPYYAMAFIDGAPLSAVIAALRRVGIGGVDGMVLRAAIAGVVPPAAAPRAAPADFTRAAVELIVTVADALGCAHAAGIVHRDVKPANILVRHDGHPLLSDFGVARQDGQPSITITEEFTGTPNYVSPEQARGERVDYRSDLFALGVTLYELLT
ncbi:MAG: serine/threonine protein kinase, partial [Planctomycetes bacterium]|nr:serine/threonine protein kinase [Planctomycetota bacterium]